MFHRGKRSEKLTVSPASGVSPGSKVRLRYASLVMYAISIAGAVLSLYFVTLLARRISVDEYGMWVMIAKYVGYFVVPTVIYSQWLPRNISRGYNTSRTGLYTSVVMGIIAVPFYLVVIQMISASFEQPLLPLVISAGFVFLDYVGYALGGIAGGYSPQIIGYTSFAFKIGQAASGWLFVGMWALGLTGGVIAALIGRILMDFVSLYMNRTLLRQSKFELSVFKSWIKSSWLPLFGAITGMIFAFDVVVVRAIYGSEVPVAFYGITMSILSVVLFSSVVTSSLYPKILSKGNLEDLREAIWLALFLTMPVICIILLYAQPLCAIFGLKYLEVAAPLKIFTLASFIQVLSSLASISYIGLENVDEKALLSKTLIKSAMFKSTIISFASNVVYLILIVSISIFALNAEELVFFWGVAYAVSFSISFVLYILLLRRDFAQRFPFKILARDLSVFVLPMLPASIPLFLINIVFEEGFYQMLQNLLLPLILSFSIYFMVLYVIDNKFRLTLRDVIRKVIFN